MRPTSNSFSIEGVHDARIDDATLRCTVDHDRLPELMDRLSGLGVLDIVAQPPTLEALFLEHYRDDMPASARSIPAGGTQ